MQQKLYIESTVWYQMVNYASSGFKERSREIFDLIKQNKFNIYISNIVLEEIAFNGKKYRDRLFTLIKEYKPLVIFENSDIETLAHAYIENAFNHTRRYDVLCDAFHAAIATAANITYMVSYNYRNLLNIHTQEHMQSVNLLAGYTNSLLILPPIMFLHLHDYSGETGSIDERVWKIKRMYGKQLVELGRKPIATRLEYHKKLTNRIIQKLSLETIAITHKTSRIIL